MGWAPAQTRMLLQHASLPAAQQSHRSLVNRCVQNLLVFTLLSCSTFKHSWLACVSPDNKDGMSPLLAPPEGGRVYASQLSRWRNKDGRVNLHDSPSSWPRMQPQHSCALSSTAHGWHLMGPHCLCMWQAPACAARHSRVGAAVPSCPGCGRSSCPGGIPAGRECS